MTTIAYRNGIIAADRLVRLQSGWLLPEQEQKLEYLGWAWVGASGSYAATRKLITWLRQAGPAAQKAIDGPGEVDARAIVMHTTSGRARIFDGNNNGWESDWTSGPLTTGSGGIIALAAMLAHSSVDADDAVKIAARLDPYTGGALDWAVVGDEHVRSTVF